MSPKRMVPDRRPESDLPPSLAEFSVGEQVQVDRILFDLVRSVCTDLGMSEGTRLRVEDRGDGEVLVRLGNGETARLPSHYAHFVQIAHVGE